MLALYYIPLEKHCCHKQWNCWPHVANHCGRPRPISP